MPSLNVQLRNCVGSMNLYSRNIDYCYGGFSRPNINLHSIKKNVSCQDCKIQVSLHSIYVEATLVPQCIKILLIVKEYLAR